MTQRPVHAKPGEICIKISLVTHHIVPTNFLGLITYEIVYVIVRVTVGESWGIGKWDFSILSAISGESIIISKY